MKTPLLLPALLFALSACSDSTESKGSQAAEKPYNPWESQMQSLDKAKGLEDQMQRDAAERDKRMREQGG
ncbi:hypothetical protein [Thiolapillus sp.]